MKKQAVLITFEGGDKCGKSTQIPLLVKKLRANKIITQVLREPGHTWLGEKIREVLLHQQQCGLSAFVEFQLFTTARRQLVEGVVAPFLKKGRGVLILDRFFDSTYVYQGAAGGFPIKKFETYERESRLGIVPDITFLLDLPVSEAMKRSTGKKDRMECKGRSYHEKVRRGYLRLAKKNPKRFVIIDGRKSIVEIHEIILKTLEKKLGIHV